MTDISKNNSPPNLPPHSMSAPIARAGVMKISPYVGGDRGANTGKKLIRLASNENNYGPSPKAIAAYQSRASANSIAIPMGRRRIYGRPLPRFMNSRPTA